MSHLLFCQCDNVPDTDGSTWLLIKIQTVQRGDRFHLFINLCLSELSKDSQKKKQLAPGKLQRALQSPCPSTNHQEQMESPRTPINKFGICDLKLPHRKSKSKFVKLPKIFNYYSSSEATEKKTSINRMLMLTLY